MKNKKNIDKNYAFELSNIIYKISKEYHIPPRIYTAILMQESKYKLNAKGCHNGLRKESVAEINYRCGDFKDCDTSPRMIEDKVCSDFGIIQAYYRTARSFKIDINKLTTDLKYSIESGARILNDFKKRYESRENDWWTRYNSSNKTKREIYKKLVEQYL